MRSSTLALLCLLGGALLPGAPPARALPPGPAVGRITALGGQEIQGVEGGLLLDRVFGPGCELPDASVRPLAAALGDGVELDVQLIACPPAAPPQGRCRVRIGDAVSPWTEAREGRVRLPVPLPRLTGIYTPALDCESGGSGLPPLPSTLYLTYAPPRPIVDPPEEAWYARACSWGAGVDRNATERQVLDRVLHQLYRFGQGHWRYGTCTIHGSSCTLGKTTVPTEGLLCNRRYNLCKCPWTDLAAGDADRNFADCYVFSQVLQYVAATLGIGGMVPQQTFGSYGLGFRTHRTARSLDPKLTGNFLCGEPTAPCGYAFYNHDLRRWGGLIYDPTFDGIYQRISELFAQSVTGSTDQNLIFEEGTACQQGVGYGGFPIYLQAPARCLLLGAGAGEPRARFSDTPPRLESPQDPLTVQVEVEIVAEGNYVVSARLDGKDQDPATLQPDGGTPVTLFPSSSREPGEGENSGSPAQTAVSGKAGIHKVLLTFSGEDLNAPLYRLTARLNDGATHLDKLDAVVGKTPPPAPAAVEIDVAHNPAKLGKCSDVQLAWEGTGSGRHLLRVTVPVNVRREEKALYGIDARLSQGETTLAYGGGKVELATGTPTLTVYFDLAELPSPATCDLALSLHWLDPVSPLGGRMMKVELSPRPAVICDSRRW